MWHLHLYQAGDSKELVPEFSKLSREAFQTDLKDTFGDKAPTVRESFSLLDLFTQFNGLTPLDLLGPARTADTIDSPSHLSDSAAHILELDTQSGGQFNAAGVLEQLISFGIKYGRRQGPS